MRPLLLLFVTAVVVYGESSRCTQKLDAGPCMAFFIHYGYDPAKGECVEFVYGGCGGNENNFQTKESCEKACIEGTTE
ncbi:unnamed protein product, partial [Strongylus vulgaris]